MGRHALVIEGGGMKAAYANGVLTAFERAGYRPWDVVYGNSAGGALAAWHGAGQAEYAEATWRYAADPRFLSVRRAARGGPLLDHEALIETVYRHEHPLDVEALRRAAHEVRVVVADADTGETLYPDIRGSDALGWVKATGRLPVGSNGPFHLQGRRFVDGGCTDPIPVQAAIGSGADRIDVILNQPIGVAQADGRAVVGAIGRRYPALAEAVQGHLEHKRRAWGLIERPPPGVRIRLVAPQRPTGIRRLSRDLPLLRRAIALGREDGRRHLRLST